jgi:hypothetical protein
VSFNITTSTMADGKLDAHVLHLTRESETLVFVMTGNFFSSLKMHLRFFGLIYFSFFLVKAKLFIKNRERKASAVTRISTQST